MRGLYGTDDLKYIPGFVWCLHVESWDESRRLQQALSVHFRSEGQQVIIAAEASQRSMPQRFFREPASVDWLEQNSNLSLDAAENVIDEIPVRVAPLLSHNAGNPRRFLGLAAAFSYDPEVLIYDTAGMDPLGMQKIHAYVRVRYKGCLIHVGPTLDLETSCCPSQLCPTQGKCLRVRSTED